MKVSIPAVAQSPPRRIVRAKPDKLPISDEKSLKEKDVYKSLNNCSEAATISEGRSAIDELFDQYPYDSTVLCLLARELCVNVIAGNHSYVPSSSSTQQQNEGKKTEESKQLVGEDEDEDDESAFLESSRVDMLRQGMSLMSARLQKSPSSPLRATTVMASSRSPNVTKSSLKSNATQSSSSGSDIPSQSSDEDEDSADEPSDPEADQEAAKQWKEVLQYISNNGAGQDLTYDEVAQGWCRAGDADMDSLAISPNRLLSYSGAPPPPPQPCRTQPYAYQTSEINDSLDSDSAYSDSVVDHDNMCSVYDNAYYDGNGTSSGNAYTEHDRGVPPAAQPPRFVPNQSSPTVPVQDSIGSFQYMKENILVDSESLDALLKNVSKYSIRSETERLFTKILGDDYMSGGGKAKKPEKEELGGSPPVKAADGKWSLPKWGRGMRFASPSKRRAEVDRMQSSSYIYPIHYASKPAAAAKSASVSKPIRYYISVPSTPTYKKTSNRSSKPLSKHTYPSQAPLYKYPKPRPPPPTPPQNQDITLLAARAGLGLDPYAGSWRCPRGQMRKPTYITMRGMGTADGSRSKKSLSATSGSAKRKKKKSPADPVIDRGISMSADAGAD